MCSLRLPSSMCAKKSSEPERNKNTFEFKVQFTRCHIAFRGNIVHALALQHFRRLTNKTNCVWRMSMVLLWMCVSYAIILRSRRGKINYRSPSVAWKKTMTRTSREKEVFCTYSFAEWSREQKKRRPFGFTAATTDKTGAAHHNKKKRRRKTTAKRLYNALVHRVFRLH